MEKIGGYAYIDLSGYTFEFDESVEVDKKIIEKIKKCTKSNKQIIFTNITLNDVLINSSFVVSSYNNLLNVPVVFDDGETGVYTLVIEYGDEKIRFTEI